MPLAVVIAGSSPQRVVALVRDDVPAGWAPPDGCVAVPQESLLPGWRMDAPIAAPVVPESITPWQLETWLWRRKAIPPTAIDSLIASLPGAERVQAEIDRRRGQSVRRDHPLIDYLGSSLGMSAEEIDTAFMQASELTR